MRNIDFIAIIGAITTIVALAPLFLTLILGDNWFEVALTTKPGFEVIKAIVAATFFIGFFIYCMLVLFVVQWINEVFRSNEIQFGEKIFSLAILMSGIIGIGYLDYFLIFVWFARSEGLLYILGMINILFLIFLALVIIISGYWIIISGTHHIGSAIFVSIITIIILIYGIATIAFPAYDTTNYVTTVMSKYTESKNYNVEFQSIRVWNDNQSPLVISILPKFKNFEETDLDLDYVNCHWSTNYGYFFTTNFDNLRTEKRTSDFEIPKCIRDQKENVSWTYDISDYSKNKPPVIISLELEDTNKKIMYEKLGEKSVVYSLGGTSSNFSWIDRDNVSINHNTSFNESFWRSIT